MIRLDHRKSAFGRAVLVTIVTALFPTAIANAADGADSTKAGSTYDNASLEAPSAPPWTPEQPKSGVEPWEAALQFPGRVVSFPLSLLGGLSRTSLLFVEETSLIPRTIAVLGSIPTLGLVLVPADLGERTGLGGRVGWFPPFMDDWLLVDMSGSFGHYHRGHVNLGKGGSSLDYQYDWRPKDRFYGLGLETSDSDTSAYALQSERWKLELVWPPRGDRFIRVPFEVGAWAGHREAVLRTGRDDEVTPFEAKHPGFASTRLDMPVGHFIYGGRVVLDRRTGIPHWGRGFRVAWSAQRFDTPVDFLAIRSGRPSGAHFTQYEFEVSTAISFWRDPRTIRFEVNALDNEVTSRVERFLPSDLAVLGGGRGLNGYEPQRWHDLDGVVGKVSYIFPLQQHFEFDVHVEAGGVYEDLQRDAKFNTLVMSYGVALRPRTKFAPLGYVGLDWSPETVRFRFSIGGVE